MMSSVGEAKLTGGGRLRANLRERGRVRAMRRAFDQLASHLPIDESEVKLSQYDIVCRAKDFIEHLKRSLAEKTAQETKKEPGRIVLGNKFLSPSEIQAFPAQESCPQVHVANADIGPVVSMVGRRSRGEEQRSTWIAETCLPLPLASNYINSIHSHQQVPSMVNAASRYSRDSIISTSSAVGAAADRSPSSSTEESLINEMYSDLLPAFSTSWQCPQLQNSMPSQDTLSSSQHLSGVKLPNQTQILSSCPAITSSSAASPEALFTVGSGHHSLPSLSLPLSGGPLKCEPSVAISSVSQAQGQRTGNGYLPPACSVLDSPVEQISGHNRKLSTSPMSDSTTLLIAEEFKSHISRRKVEQHRVSINKRLREQSKSVREGIDLLREYVPVERSESHLRTADLLRRAASYIDLLRELASS